MLNLKLLSLRHFSTALDIKNFEIKSVEYKELQSP